MDEEQTTDPAEPMVETESESIQPEPITRPFELEPIFEQKIEPVSTPVTELEKPEEPVPESTPATPTTLPEAPPTPLTVTQPQPFDINSLTDEQLKAAAALYTKRNQAEISRKGVAKRKEIMEINLREIMDFLSLNNGAPLPRIAKNANVTPGTTSKYLRQLMASGKVRADGWGKTRRYYLN